MTARHALRPTLAASPIWFGLLLLGTSNLGCVDLKQPAALAHPAGNVAGSSGGGKAGSTGSGGTSAAGGTSASFAVDAGQGGNTTSSSTDSNQGGNSAVDTSSTGTGGSGSEGGTGGEGTGGDTGTAGSTGTGGTGAGGTGAGGTGGKTGTAGSTGTGGTGTGGTGTGGTGTGGIGGTAGTSAKGGSAGQTSVVPDAGPDAPDTALARDTQPPDAFCAICAIGKTLVHRYNFNGNGTTVTDSVGTANGTVVNAQLSGSGTLVLAGGTSNQYADFPDHILNTLTNATLELWVTWNGGSNNNQRILDFGSSRQNGTTYLGVTTVIISPNSFIDNAARLRASYCSDTAVADSNKFTDATGPLATGSPQQVVAVFDGTAHTLTMYVNGVVQGTAATGLGALSLIDDVNNYLGKSQYSGDPGFDGTYHEFRIYNAALTAAQVQTVFTAGQNTSFN